MPKFLISQNLRGKTLNSSMGWREIGDKRIYCRSMWEANFARYLQFLKENKHILDWLHEPYTFWFEKIKRGVRSYRPDFKILEAQDVHSWVEVKGYYDSKSLTKIKRLQKYYPNEKLRIVDKKWFISNSKKLKGLIKGWETKNYER
jgi:hypothetical protein